jgi:hypothetical protein
MWLGESNVLSSLKDKIKNHAGDFLCVEIGNENSTKTCTFSHVVDPPEACVGVPDLGDLKEFFSTFGSITLYFEPESNDAALYVANPSQWQQLDTDFSGWLEGLDQDEETALLPAWISSRIVVGEIPASGNYILVPTVGNEIGNVFEFEHDGFEFIRRADDLESYITQMLEPQVADFSRIASYMRFIVSDPLIQWWARELRDNTGRVVRNEN